MSQEERDRERNLFAVGFATGVLEAMRAVHGIQGFAYGRGMIPGFLLGIGLASTISDWLGLGLCIALFAVHFRLGREESRRWKELASLCLKAT